MKLPRLGEFKVLTLREVAPEFGTCDTPEMASKYWREHIATDVRHNPDVESMVCLMLSTRRKVQGHYVVATGTLDTLLAHPREVFRAAIVANASAIIMMHNHPSGDHTPSESDIKVTRDMMRAGQLIKIDMLDHVVMGTAEDGRTRDYASLRELGYMLASPSIH